LNAERIVCLVAAAGRGIRLGRDMPKSFYPVRGKTLLVRALQSIEAWGGVSRYIVMVPAGWEERAAEEIHGSAPDFEFEVLAGGESRQESVAIGLGAIENADLVLVHDACRPIVSPALIERVVKAAREFGAAVPALQATDTLGRLRDEILESIVPRDRVIGIQTPQAFRLEVLEQAFETAVETIRRSTDESSLVLSAGLPVHVVEGERWNIKVTVKEDLEIAASLLEGGKLELPGPGVT